MADTTPTLREAAQQALEALEHATTIIDGAIYCGHELNEAGIKKRAAINFRITALRAALAEQAAEQAEPVAVPAGYALVPVEQTEAMLAAAHEGDRQYTLRNFGDVMTVMQGPYDHWHAMIAAAPPAPARQEPLTESQVDDLIHSKHFDRSYKLHASDETCLRWYRLGLRDGERAHGIVAAPAEREKR